MRDRRNDILNNVAFVQYVYDGDEENIIQKPHQNTKKGRAPGYTRTKANLSSMGPKEAVFQATRDAGGVMQVDSLSCLPTWCTSGVLPKSGKEGASTSLSSG